MLFSHFLHVCIWHSYTCLHIREQAPNTLLHCVKLVLVIFSFPLRFSLSFCPSPSAFLLLSFPLFLYTPFASMHISTNKFAFVRSRLLALSLSLWYLETRTYIYFDNLTYSLFLPRYDIRTNIQLLGGCLIAKSRETSYRFALCPPPFSILPHSPFHIPIILGFVCVLYMYIYIYSF